MHMCIYYIYCWCKKDGTPYYIGKGKNNRAWEKHGNYYPPKGRVVIMESQLTELGAFALERRYIRWYGLENLKNQTYGGEGISGYKHTNHSKKKMSLRKKGQKRNEHARQQIAKGKLGKKRKPFTEKHKKNLSESNKGVLRSSETKKRISEALKGRKHSEETLKKLRTPKQKIICPHCKKTGGSSQMKRWHFDNCKLHLMENKLVC